MDAVKGGFEPDKQYKILVCTSQLIFEGMFTCKISQRLIEALNEGVRENPMLKAIDFLPMENVTIMDVKGQKQIASRIYVAKNNVIFVAQISSEVEEKKLGVYPYRKKLPVGVTIYTGQTFAAQEYAQLYTLKGQLYLETWGQVLNTIETKDQFLPLTQVMVEPALLSREVQYDFVAINKECVISICEDSDQRT